MTIRHLAATARRNLAALGNRLLDTTIDRRICDWPNTTGDTDD